MDTRFVVVRFEFEIKVALFEGQIIDSIKVGALAKIPSRVELLGQLAGMLNSPMSKLLFALNGVMYNLVNAVKALEEKKR